MNRIAFLALLITFNLCAQTEVRFQAEIQNPNSDSIVIHNKDFKITLKGKNGKFTDSFKPKKGFYQFFDGAQFGMLYLSEGFDLKLTADGKRFAETLSFSGIGSKENIFLLEKKTEDQKLKEIFRSEIPSDTQLQLLLEKRLLDAKTRIASEEYESDFPKLMLEEYERENKEIKAKLEAFRAKENGISILKNTQAPEFDFENHKGGKTKLSSLKGKLIYIDIWATWCGPCRVEIPHLKKLVHGFEKQNITFVSISIDELKNHEKWKNFVSDQALDGIQLLADNAWQSEWIKHFKITGIPRFIIIGTDGKIVNPDAPRPSSAELSKMLTDLLK